MQAFVPSHAVLPRSPPRSGRAACPRRRAVAPTAEYLSPGAFDVDLSTRSRYGNFGAVFFGLMRGAGSDADAADAAAPPRDVVIKLPIDNDLGRKLYDMERHSNAKLARALLQTPDARRVADFVGELIVPPDAPVAPGLARVGLVWRRAASDDTLEDYLGSAQVPALAAALGASPAASPLRRDLAAALMRQLALVLQDIQSCGIVHRDFKPENILVVPSNAPDARLQMIDFGSSCDWASPLKKGLRLATLDPVYGAPEQRLNLFRPALRFDVYSAGLMTLRAALPSLTDAAQTQAFVSDVLARCDGSFARAVPAVLSGRYPVSPEVVRDVTALDSPEYGDLFAVLCTMLTDRPEDRASVEDCLQSRFLRSVSVA